MYLRKDHHSLKPAQNAPSQGRNSPPVQSRVLQAAVPASATAGVIAASDKIKQFTAIRKIANNSEQALRLRSYQAMADSSRKANTHAPVQMLRHESLAEHDYGTGLSSQAYNKRIEDGIHPKQNIATFHFTKRPPLDGEADGLGFSRTAASTGFGVYVEVSNRTHAEKKINASHSEHGLIHGDLEALRNQQKFPQEYVIDWVYTERPACPDVWYGQKHIANGCSTELETVERAQKTRLYDVGPNGDSPYGYRPDLDITVYSTFESAAEIREAAYFAHVRIAAVNKLYAELLIIMEEQYAHEGVGEEHNLMEYERDIPASARAMANQLPSWSDYEIPMTKTGLAEFAEELQKEAAEILKSIE